MAIRQALLAHFERGDRFLTLEAVRQKNLRQLHQWVDFSDEGSRTGVNQRNFEVYDLALFMLSSGCWFLFAACLANSQPPFGKM